MKNKLWKLFVLLIVLSVLMFSFMFAENIEQKACLYKINSSSKEWRTFTTKAEMISVTRLSEEVLQSLSTVELLEAVFDYPMSIDMLLYNTSIEGVEALREHCQALDRFLEKSDALSVADNYVNDENDVGIRMKLNVIKEYLGSVEK